MNHSDQPPQVEDVNETAQYAAAGLACPGELPPP